MIINFANLCVLILCVSKTLSTNRWPNHDISTLKLLQIVHRHGDRTPVGFPTNDPFKGESYWPEGVAQLTTKGKYRMYKLGQFIRQEYEQYLGDKYSVREVYARSSSADRCIESVSCLLSGAYPPKKTFQQWNNGSDAELGRIWQPFPIQTFIPKEGDLILEQDKSCPAAKRERDRIYNRTTFKELMEKHKELYTNLTKITGTRIFDILSASSISSTLIIEMDHNYYWDKIWTHEEERKIAEQLFEETLIRYRYSWDSPIIKRLRNGGLVKELNNNFQRVLENENNKKLFVYSTHDTEVAGLLHALNLFNDRPPPFGATLFFELHQKTKNEFFVKVFYHNETVINSGIPHSVQWGDCNNQYDCPIDQYFNSTKILLYEDFDKECNQTE